jgi:hypothetical protein
MRHLRRTHKGNQFVHIFIKVKKDVKYSSAGPLQGM